MNQRYPWYEVAEGPALGQGDLLRQCPVVVPSADMAFPLVDDTAVADILTFDLVVVTQSCDLANDKVTDVILCPHWDLTDAALVDPVLRRRDFQRDVLAGRRYRYTMLAASEIPNMPMGTRIVDFGRVFCLPKAFLRPFAANQGARLRLCPPYREHLSQAFARFFMRVGLPQDIELPPL